MAAADKDKKSNKKLRTYLVMQHLLKNTDERHPAQMSDILQYLSEDCGIEADRRSVYEDFKDINRILYMLDQQAADEECTIQDAEAAFEDEEADPYVVMGETNRSGYFISQRPYGIERDDVRLLAECIHNARFISKSEEKSLLNIVRGLVNQWDAQELESDILLVDRMKTTNNSVFNNVVSINYAMRKGTVADPHLPEKITFKYQKYTIQDVNKTVYRRQGALYKVSPYKLLINDGNYYLLAFDDRYQDMRTYRVDRMKDVRTTGETRDGEETFAALDLENYTQRVFGMMGGEKVRVVLRFINPLLDTAIERFGTKGVFYYKLDEGHFTAAPQVEISDQFFSWVCGFGNRVKILEPEPVVQQFQLFLKKITNLY